jgi:NAD(P)-dependent dehydrogenase (short-subunit alcohol dehydrogenase family)
MSRFTVAGKTAVVTGGGSGIGKETVKVLSEHGAAIVVADFDEAKGKAAAEEIRAAGGKAAFVKTNVTSFADCENMVAAAVREFGRLDILVNNAGIVLPGTAVTTTEADFDKLFAVNVKGVFLCCKAALPVMIRQKSGSIVNMASVAGISAVKERMAYCSTKGAVVAMTRALAVDHVGDGVRVNCVCPGTVHTPLVEGYIKQYYEPQGKSRDEMLKLLDARQPMGRMAKPEEIADAVLYLAGDAGAFCTGSALIVDGGWMGAR